MARNYKDKIDNWLENLSDETAQVVWKVAKAINVEWELSKDAVFQVPDDRIKEEGVNEKDKKFVLSQFREIGILVDVYVPEVIVISTNKAAWKFPHNEPFNYLIFALKQRLENKNLRSVAEDHDRELPKPILNWESIKSDSGVLVLPDGIKIPFRGGNFGGVYELVKNINHDITIQRLRESIAEHLQGSAKEPTLINITGWKSDLKRKRKIFFDYFTIEHFPPDKHRLTYKKIP